MFNRIQLITRLIAFNLIIATAAIVFADSALPMPVAPGEALPAGYMMVEEDIVLPEWAHDSTRATYEAVLWPQGNIPYVFGAAISADNRNRMRAAMNEWETVAGVTFVPYTNEQNYLEVIDAGSNWSQIGMTGGKQQISIFSWTTHYVIMHELAHTLGFWHEQSRPDRDQYVTINWKNISESQKHNFAIRETADTAGAYDFESVMHYNQYAFSSNSLPTITANAGHTQHQHAMGQRTRLSAQDIAGMVQLYPIKNPVFAGDKQTNAITVPSQAQFAATISTAGYTVSAGDPVLTCAPSAGATVWYATTSDYSRTLTVSASGYDTVLGIYTASMQQVACANNNTNGAERVVINAAAGQTYYIVVGGYQSASGILQLNINSDRALLQNGDFENGASAWMVKTDNSNNNTHKCGSNAAWESACAFSFGGGAKAQISQKINVNQIAGLTFSKGQVYTFSFGLASATNTPSAVTGKVVVTYNNGKKQTITTPLITDASASYKTYSTDIVLKRANVKNIKVMLISAANGGQVYVDNVQFRAASAAMLDILEPVADSAVLPMPAAPADFRGSN